MSVTRHDALYGVPIRFSLDPDVEAEAPTIDVKQTRYDARAEVPLSGFFSQLRLRGGYAEYRHDEIEDTGEIASTFFTKGGEGRAEMVQTERGGWGGTSGVQYFKRKVKIDGEEKFLPDSQQHQAGLFTMQSLVKGHAAARGRLPRRVQQAGRGCGCRPRHAGDEPRFHDLSRARSAAAYEFSPGWRAGLTCRAARGLPRSTSCSPTARMPAPRRSKSAIPTSTRKRASAIEASIRKHGGPVKLTATALLQPLLQLHLPGADRRDRGRPAGVRYLQGKANYYGFEVEANAELGNAMGIHWDGDLVADYVHAKVEDFGPAPQIPPLRLLGGISANGGPVEGRLEVEHAFRQSRNAPLETETDGYTLVNASLDWQPLDGQAGADPGHCRQQHLRRRRAASLQPAQGLCAAGGPRHQADGERFVNGPGFEPSPRIPRNQRMLAGAVLRR